MTDNPFDHDPTDSQDIDPSAPTSFDEARGGLESTPEAEGLGFVVNRHDPYLVIEAANVVDEGELIPSAVKILNALGRTFAEKEGDNSIRALYHGELPEPLHGGDPVLIKLKGETRSYLLRIYDSGWTPVTGRHINGWPTEIQDVDQNALRTILSQTGKLDR